MTLAEAMADVEHWRRFADTVGGDAIVVRDPQMPFESATLECTHCGRRMRFQIDGCGDCGAPPSAIIELPK